MIAPGSSNAMWRYEQFAACLLYTSATIDAWDPTIDAADAIGVAFMDGIIAGIESRQAALNAKMQEVSDQAYRTTQAYNLIESPSQLYALSLIHIFIPSGSMSGARPTASRLMWTWIRPPGC